MTRSFNIVFCILLVLICTSCSSEEQYYQFPLKQEDVEKALADQKLDWKIDDVVYGKDSPQVIFSSKWDNGVYLGISSTIYENSKILFISWSLPYEFTVEQFDEFYHNDISEIFDFAGTVYGSSKKMKKGLNEFTEYYKKVEGDYKGGLFWTNRIGDDHIKIDIKPYPGPQDNRNRVGLLLIENSTSYEYLQQNSYENWIKSAQHDSIKIIDSTVEGLSNYEPPINYEGFYGEHFVIQGHLENIKKIKTVPDSLKNIVSSQFLKPNRDKYLSAKLIDATGSVDVFLQTTSLNAEELSKERNHNVVLFYYENNPILVVRFSPID